MFISKATPGDDEFALWLAPRLEAEGYRVFADIRALQAGDRWRKVLTQTLQQDAIKMLLCCSDETLARDGVQEEIGIATDLVKELNDRRFIIPLRLASFRKVFGIGELQYIDFVRGWAEGFTKLLDTLKRQQVPRNANGIEIDPIWEQFRRRGAVALRDVPERLTSNWLRVAEAPDNIRYFEPNGAIDRKVLDAAVERRSYPMRQHNGGLISFATEDEINRSMDNTGRFNSVHEVSLRSFLAEGMGVLKLRQQDASNIVVGMFREAWERALRNKHLIEYRFSNASGFHAGAAQAAIGQKIPWGRQGDRRSSMLRNVARGHVWQFGVTGLPTVWPFMHFKLKSRVLFALPQGDEAGPPIADTKKQHRLRRSVCKGWRNKQWHGRLMAFLEMLSEDSSFIRLQLSEDAELLLEATPLLFTSPVSTELPNLLTDEDEEADASTLGRPEPEEEG
ncbi:MAG: toll/interleukin-1 receptor domain-containing protein [Rhodomicrobium sp.]